MSGTSQLFVYGTLMSTATSTLGRDMRLRLRREARVMGAATLQGRLFDRGRYPVMVFSEDPADIVHGELLEISDAATTFPWLDAYEGIGKSATGDEYVRVESSVKLASGGEHLCWVYLFQRPVAGLPRIRSGRWQSRP